MPQALLVDDDEAFLAALAEAVARENFSTRTATTLAAAKAAIGGGAPDVVLIDLHLPDGSGMELLEELSAFPSTEVVLITGQASVETAVEALRRGASDYLVKPVDLGRVKAVLANVSHTRELKQLAASLPWARHTTRGDALPPVFGRYKVEAEIGEGAMGRVFRCRDPLVGRAVAVKTVKSEYLSDETRGEYLHRFRREAQAAGVLSHPGIVNIYDVGDEYIVMEYVEGATLAQLLRNQHALDFSSALRVLAPLAEALDYAHAAGVIHRDIKPSNIMVQPDGRPKLMDFGVARLDSSTATRTGHVLGSPSYMAPEQILGESLTTRADLFSFAVVAYEALTGRRPFPGDSVPAIVYRVVNDLASAPSTFNRELPALCDAVFVRALSKDPAARYADATTFVAALMGADTGAAIPAISPDPLLESLLSSVPRPATALITDVAQGAVPAPERDAVAGPKVAVTTTLNTVLSRLLAAQAAARRRWPQGLVAGLLMLALAAGLLLLALPVAFWPNGRSATSPGGSGPLRIETQPVGMPVWIDGRPAGRSPLVLPLAPGTHHVRVFEQGYAPAELSIELNAGTTAAPLRFVMMPLTAAAPSEPPAPSMTPTPGRMADARKPEIPRPASTPPKVLREGDLVALTAAVRPPRRVSGQSPEYPAEARRLGLTGSVLIEMIVTEQGRPERIRVLESAGAILDQTVVEAASSWKFEPAVLDGVKVRVRWPYRHTFVRR